MDRSLRSRMLAVALAWTAAACGDGGDGGDPGGTGTLVSTGGFGGTTTYAMTCREPQLGGTDLDNYVINCSADAPAPYRLLSFNVSFTGTTARTYAWSEFNSQTRKGMMVMVSEVPGSPYYFVSGDGQTVIQSLGDHVVGSFSGQLSGVAGSHGVQTWSIRGTFDTRR